MNKTPNKYSALYICLALVLTTLAVYGQVREHDFIGFDDNLYVTDNYHVQAGLTRDSITWAFTTSHAANWHPLTWISHMLDCQLYGLNPAGHHSTNLLFHVLNTVLLFLVLKRMTGNLWSSAFVAAAFSLHPLHVESVTWVSERKDVLSTFFWMLTMWAYVRYAERPDSGRYLLVVLAFCLGLMAKQMLVTLPFVLLLLDYWPLRRFKFREQSSCNSTQIVVSASARRCILEKVPLLILSGIAGTIVYFVQQHLGLVKSVNQYPLAVRVGNALIAYTVYIGKMLWPTHLAVFYPHPRSALLAWQIARAALLLVSITTAVIWKLRQRPYLAVGWLWYLGTLVPVIGLVQVGLQALADRYTYMTLTGLFIIIAWGIPDILARLQYRKPILSLSAMVLLSVLGIMAWRQVTHWRNSITLYKHAIAAVPYNRWAYKSLGRVAARQGKFDEAVMYSTRALQLKPDDLEAHCNLANALTHQGSLDEAIVRFTQALLIKPDFTMAHLGLANALLQQGKIKQAISHYNEALRIEPLNPDIHSRLGIAFAKVGKPDEAIMHFTMALQLRPNHPGMHTNLGAALAQQGRLDEAIIHFTEALRINPRSLRARKNIGVAFFNQGRFDEAIASFNEALRIKPDDPDVLNCLRSAQKQRDSLRKPEDENEKR